MTLNQALTEKRVGKMSKISKILPATTFGFAPMVTNSLGQSYQSGPSTNLEPS